MYFVMQLCFFCIRLYAQCNKKLNIFYISCICVNTYKEILKSFSIPGLSTNTRQQECHFSLQDELLMHILLHSMN